MECSGRLSKVWPEVHLVAPWEASHDASAGHRHAEAVAAHSKTCSAACWVVEDAGRHNAVVARGIRSCPLPADVSGKAAVV